MKGRERGMGRGGRRERGGGWRGRREKVLHVCGHGDNEKLNVETSNNSNSIHMIPS